MKRRNFLGLFGAAVTAPFLPASAAARVAGAAPYSAAAMHAAIYHAQSRAVFSVWGLARAVGVSAETAEVLMGDLAKRGVLGPLQGTTFGGRWASSKIMTREALALQQTARKTSTGRASHDAASTQTTYAEPDLGKLIAHLRQLCRDRGMTLAPVCATT